MNKFLKSLPALAFALAASVAFAFNMADEGTLKHQDEEGNWIPVEGSYQCDQSSETCTALFDENDNMISGSEVEGEFVQL
ncbi:hypothetical protein KZP23_14705 [Echinicola marina]|uniref:DUF6520 family protein n=1 Tax=Echinicola marina TaxID=2859768 RepID=UPI001CF63788|nr:DUF6520 family protein [Echinicola marina]UCS91970.1 hypothetical protein KZP23_14705 [Echinicola marina]